MPHPYVVLKRYASQSSEQEHEVRQNGDGDIYCSCWAWRKSTATPKTCKHLEQFIREEIGG